VHFVTGEPFARPDFGSFPGLPRENLQQHEVIYLIVLGSAAAGIAAVLFLCELTNAGKAFPAIREDPLLAQSPQATGKPASK